MKTTIPLIAALALIAGATSATAEIAIKLERIYENQKFERPLQANIPPDGSGRLFFVQQTGKIFILPSDEKSAERKTFLDFADRKMASNAFEEGLLNLTFHPNFKKNRTFYIYYSQQNPKRSVISEMKTSAGDPDKADLNSERVLLEVPQPFWNHNSGNMAFGPDGYLYICFGDGGKGNDPHNLAQNLWALNGKIIRIDVNQKQGAREYAIPADNPFLSKGADEKGIREEIWCYGMRNPWGIYFDNENNRFWCADVGQNKFEEINLIEKGGNYGWNFREGMHKFDVRTDDPPKKSKFVEPVHEYPRTDGISITGGVVYRGSAVPALAGHYLYGDWGSQTIWALKLDSDDNVASNEIVFQDSEKNGVKPTAFCFDSKGEVLVLSWTGTVHRIAAK